MNARLKIVAGFMIAAFWIGTLALKHVWPDIDIGGLVAAYISGLGAIGIHSVVQIKQVSLPPPSTDSTTKE